jgi:hypothetical protein
MPNLKSTKLAGRRARIDPFIPNVVEKPLPHISQKRIDFLPLPLGDQFDSSVGKVLHVSRHIEPAGD